MFRRIQWRIAIPFVLLIVVSMSILGIYFVNVVRDAQIANLRLQLTQDAKLIAEAVMPSLQDINKVGEVDLLTKELGNKIDSRVTIIAPSGIVLGDSQEDPAKMENHATRPEIVDAVTLGIGESVRHSSTIGERMMYVAVPIVGQGQTLGVARVALSMEKVERAMNLVTGATIMAIIVTAILATIAALLIARATAQPIRQLTTAARNLASGNLEQQINVRSSDEVGQLAQAFNDMSLKLKERVRELSDERNTLAAILSNMADALIMVDTERIVLLANRASQSLFGIPTGNIEGQRLIHIVPDHEVDQVVQRCLQMRQEQSAQVQFGTEKRFLRIIAVPLLSDRLAGALVLFQDLTELRSLQTMRREFIGNISHELRTPLTSIKAMVETLQHGAFKDREVASDFLTRIDGELDKITQMADELTELSRIETGQAKLKLEPTNINHLVEQVVGRMMPQAERQGVTLSTVLLPELPSVGADRERIQQVILNLVHNAIKFTPAGGKATISTKVQKEALIVTIEDTGIGISKEDLPHVFERFYKADKARTGSGTGLGLAIANHIVQAHGGTINASSEEGKGSTFSFSLPL